MASKLQAAGDAAFAAMDKVVSAAFRRADLCLVRTVLEKKAVKNLQEPAP